MKRLNAAVVFVAIMCAVPTTAQAQVSDVGKEREIVATGIGQVEADPDKARILITIRAFGKTEDEAGEVCAVYYMHLLDTLKAAGIGPERVITRYLDATPEMHEKKLGKAIGHWVVHYLYVDTKDVDEILKIASHVLYSGVASVYIKWVLSSKADSVRSAALAEAASDAKAEAEAMASAAGGQLGELIELTSHYTKNPEFPTMYEVAECALKAGIIQGFSIKPKKVKVNASVLSRWRLIGGFEY